MLRYSIPAGGHGIQRSCLALALLGMVLYGKTLAHASPDDLDRLVGAYPDFLVRHDGSSLFWKDGTSTPISPRKNNTFDDKLKHATLEDQMSLPYPKGRLSSPPGPNDDPGRFEAPTFLIRCMEIAPREKLKSTS